MNKLNNFSRLLKTTEDTQEFAAAFAKLCKIGDCILLYGNVGAGKTTFARGFIQSISLTQEEIVSPTFTLVQTYQLMENGERGGGDIWHCDLYRLKNNCELIELGLDEGFEKGIVLVEWPEIAASEMPENALSISFEMEGEGRRITISGKADIWEDRLNKI